MTEDPVTRHTIVVYLIDFTITLSKNFKIMAENKFEENFYLKILPIKKKKDIA